jgi:glycosyltransferase involved in cell wall biosynthesis
MTDAPGADISVCALVPAFDEASSIATVVAGAAAHVAHVVVVDDGSTDGTGDAARAAGAEVITLAANAGKGTAIRTGLERIGARGFSHVLLIDGDLQHRPDEIPRLVEAARSTGAALVVGERVFDRARMPASRYWANVVGSWALSTLMGVRLRDTQSGFRLLRLDVARTLPLRATGYEIETELIVKLGKRRALVVGVPVTAVYNGQRSKLRPVRDTTRNVVLAIVYRFTNDA